MSPPRCPSSSKATSASSAPASTRTCPSTCWRPTGSPHGDGSQLLHQGYPLGPHAIVVALNKGLGIGLVQGFSGLTIAVAVLAPLTALAAFADQPPLRRTAGALLVGLAYMVASYFAQGAFKETMQALFVLAFVLALRESTHAAWRDLPLRFVPAALIAVGTVYAYSFPGLIWLVGDRGDLGICGRALCGWHGAGGSRTSPARRPPLTRARTRSSRGAASCSPSSSWSSTLPELGPDDRLPQLRDLRPRRPRPRQPVRPGLALRGARNLALGRLPAGARATARCRRLGYYLGAAFASVLLLYGLRRCWRRRETAIVAGLARGAAAVYAAARIGGTPYTAAKAIEVAAARGSVVRPAARPRLARSAAAGVPQPPRPAARSLPARRRRLLAARPRQRPGRPDLLLAGPDRAAPAARRRFDPGPRPDALLDEEHGVRYIAWELRGGRVCIEPTSAAGGAPPTGVRCFVIPRLTAAAALRRLRPAPAPRRSGSGPSSAVSPCPLIAVRQARQGPAAELSALIAERASARARARPAASARPWVAWAASRPTTKITVKLPDGTPLELPEGASGADAAAAIGPGLAKAALAIRVDGELRDLAAPLPDGAEIAIVTDRDPEALELIRHDAAHVMAEAVLELYPGDEGDDRPADRAAASTTTSSSRRTSRSPRPTSSGSRRRCATTSRPTSPSSAATCPSPRRSSSSAPRARTTRSS